VISESRQYSSEGGSVGARPPVAARVDRRAKTAFSKSRQAWVSKDRPKPADTQPKSAFMQECIAIKETFFNVNTYSIMAINSMIMFVPLGIASQKLGWGCLSVFGFNFLAIIPLAAVLGAATESMSRHTGQVLGGLLNATLGNAVEMSVTFFAVRNGMVEVVQMSLIGSLLSNLLLVLGMSFIAAGIKNHESNFNASGAISNTSCLVLASLALTLPTVYTTLPGVKQEEVVMLSRIIACVMAFVYACFLYFQLHTHSALFEPDRALAPAPLPVVPEEEQISTLQQDGKGLHLMDLRAATEDLVPEFREQTRELEFAPMYEVSLVTSVIILGVSTVSVMVCSNFLVASIDSVSAEYNMPYAFIGLILLPIVGNAAEHTTAVTAAYHDLMDLSMGVAIGSSTQVALFVIPYSVIIGWCYGVPMGLDFNLFSTTVFLLSVFIASGVLSDGSGNWFEGTMLCATYVIVAIITWYIPDSGKPHSVFTITARHLAETAAFPSLAVDGSTWLAI